jgi:hypothetical protein
LRKSLRGLALREANHKTATRVTIKRPESNGWKTLGGNFNYIRDLPRLVEVQSCKQVLKLFPVSGTTASITTAKYVLQKTGRHTPKYY